MSRSRRRCSEVVESAAAGVVVNDDNVKWKRSGRGSRWQCPALCARSGAPQPLDIAQAAFLAVLDALRAVSRIDDLLVDTESL